MEIFLITLDKILEQVLRGEIGVNKLNVIGERQTFKLCRMTMKNSQLELPM